MQGSAPRSGMRGAASKSMLSRLALIVVPLEVAGRCLVEEKPLLHRRPALPYIMLEMHNWASSQLSSAIFRILVEEYLGYEVVENRVGTSNRAFKRASLKSGNIEKDGADGTALLQALANGDEFGYVALEVWTEQQQSDIDYFTTETKQVSLAGRIGYVGRSGLYTASTSARSPLNLEFFKNLRIDTSFPESVQRFRLINESSHSIDCSDASRGTDDASRLWPFRYWDTDPANSTILACDNGDCSLWCPAHVVGESTFGPIPIFHFPGYERKIFEEVAHNMGLHVAFRYLDLPVSSFVNEILRHRAPFLFYFWVPSVGIATNDFSRVWLPVEDDCGEHDGSDSNHLGTWKCDKSAEHLLKVMSNSIPEYAPLLEDLIVHFKIPVGTKVSADLLQSNISAADVDLHGAGINQLLGFYGHFQSVMPEGDADELIQSLACQWVRQNRDTWENWTDRDLPWWVNISHPLLIKVSSALLAACICWIVAWEVFWLRSGMFGRHCSRRVKKLDRLFVDSASVGLQSVTWAHSLRSSMTRRPSTNSGDTQSSRRTIEEEADGSPADLCTIDWATSLSFEAPPCGVIQLEAARQGDVSGAAMVVVSAHGGDAKQGQDYRLLSSHCVFKPGERTSCIQAEILSAPDFGRSYKARRGFYVSLDEVVKGRAQLRRPNAKVHVSIRGVGSFLDFDGKRSTSNLLKRWLKLLYFEDRASFWRAAGCKVYESLHEVVVMILTLQVIVDQMLSDSLWAVAPVAAAVIFLSAIITRWLDRAFVKYSRAGQISMRLRAQILRKFWNLSMQSHFRLDVHQVRWLMSLLRANEITSSWLNLFDVVGQVAKLVFSFFVIFVTASQWFTVSSLSDLFFEQAHIFVTIVAYATLSFLIFLVVALGGRAHEQANLVERCEKQLDLIVKQFMWTLQNWSIVVSDSPRLDKVDHIQQHAMQANNEYAALLREVWLGEITTYWISKYVSYAIRVALMYYGAVTVMDAERYGVGQFTIGSFISIVQIVDVFGETITKLNQDGLQFIRAGGELNNYAALLYLDAEGAETEEADDSYSVNTPSFGDDRIVLENVCFSYGRNLADVIHACSMEIPLGCSFMIDGPRNVGKLTLLRLLMGRHTMRPRSGALHVPPWMRICLLDGTTNFIAGMSMHDHILMGASSDGEESNAHLLARVLPLHGMYNVVGRETITSIDSDSDGDSIANLSEHADEDIEHLTVRERFTVHVARALLRDPDLMLVNTRAVPEDHWTERIYVLLSMWQLAGGLDGLAKELTEMETAAASARTGQRSISAPQLLRRLEVLKKRRAAGGGAGAPQRTLVILPPSARRLLHRPVGSSFGRLIRLSDSDRVLSGSSLFWDCAGNLQEPVRGRGAGRRGGAPAEQHGLALAAGPRRHRLGRLPRGREPSDPGI